MKKLISESATLMKATTLSRFVAQQGVISYLGLGTDAGKVIVALFGYLGLSSQIEEYLTVAEGGDRIKSALDVAVAQNKFALVPAGFFNEGKPVDNQIEEIMNQSVSSTTTALAQGNLTYVASFIQSFALSFLKKDKNAPTKLVIGPGPYLKEISPEFTGDIMTFPVPGGATNACKLLKGELSLDDPKYTKLKAKLEELGLTLNDVAVAGNPGLATDGIELASEPVHRANQKVYLLLCRTGTGSATPSLREIVSNMLSKPKMPIGPGITAVFS